MEKLKPEQVMEMLHRKGQYITLEQAALVLEFMRKLSKMVISNYITVQQQKDFAFLKGMSMRQ